MVDGSHFARTIQSIELSHSLIIWLKNSPFLFQALHMPLLPEEEDIPIEAANMVQEFYMDTFSDELAQELNS
jgi:hypothetical protein